MSCASVSSSLLVLCSLLALCASAYNVRTEIGYMPYQRVADAIPLSGSKLFLALSSGSNTSVSEYELGTGVKRMIVENQQGGGCVPAFNDPPFHSQYPIVPMSIHYIAARNQLLIADRVPSNRIFQVTRSGHVSLSQNLSANVYSTVTGAACAFAEQSFEETPEGVPSNASMTTPQSMAFDPVTGNLYFSLKYSVAVLYPNGTKNYFFGSDKRRGSRNDLWNLQEQDRRNATTLYPLQLSLDHVTRTLYVAEQGYSTVRAISLDNDTATIVLGKLEGSYVWPPPTCFPDACHHSDVVLQNVVAVASYYPRTVPERWLFVGDRTLAQVFKFVLDTGMVYAVGGVSLTTGTIDGPAGTSRFRSITMFSTAESTLFISDGGLRVMDLEDRATPAPPIVSEEVVTGSTTTIMITTVIASNPMGIVQVSRANVILELLRCQRQFGYLDPINHLLQFPIGDDPDFQYYAGAVVGNTALALGFVALHAFLSWVIATAWETTFGSATASLRFPSLVAFPLMFVMESTMASSVSLSLYAEGYYQAIGIAGIVGCVSVTAGIAVYFAFVFEGARTDEFELTKRYSGLLARFIRPVGEWVTTDNNRRMGMFFNDYLPNRWWFALVELVMCIATGIAEGIKPIVHEQCVALIAYATVMYSVFFTLLMFLQPNVVRLKFATSVVIAGLQAIACYMLIATITTRDRGWEATSTSLVLASLYIGLPRSLLELCELVVDVYKLIKEQSMSKLNVEVNARPIMIRSASDSGSSTNSSIIMDPIFADDTIPRKEGDDNNNHSFGTGGGASFQFPKSDRTPNTSMVGPLEHERLREELRAYMKKGVDGHVVRTAANSSPTSPRSPSPSPPPPPPPPPPPSRKGRTPKSDSSSSSSSETESMSESDL